MDVSLLAALLDRAEAIFRAHKHIRKLWHDIAHGGKMDFGTIQLVDMNGVGWKIKVRWRGDRQHYLKLKTVDHQQKIKFRAGTTKHIEKPWKYKALALEEWRVFAVAGIDDDELENLTLKFECKEACRELLNELVYERRLGVEAE